MKPSTIPRKTWYGVSALVLWGMLVAIVLVGTTSFFTPLTRWVGIMLLMAAFILLAGQGVTGLLYGALIDERNKVSLSRLQLVIWSILIISAFLTAALMNVWGGVADPLAIAVPEEVWLLLGISATSFVGSPLIKSAKREQPESPGAEMRARAQLAVQGRDPDAVKFDGLLARNVTMEAASWSDLLRGEEAGNAAHLDLGKVQLLFFTVVLVIAYAVALGEMLQDAQGAITSFPDLHPSMIALLGISHSGYLAHKAIPHTSPTPV